jgi:ATP-dependent Clp protease ATP-binding subunit ClpC
MSKLLLLPVHLLKFWYPESLVVFIRIWKNVIAYLEEDLAVTLMIKLLWVPLFHDSTIIGQILSLIFRMIRIILGLFAFAFATLLILSVALVWFLAPVLLFFKVLNLVGVFFILSVVGLFVIHILSHPHKKVWQVSEKDLWLASKIKQKDLSWESLLKSPEVQLILKYLEIGEEKWEGGDVKWDNEVRSEIAKTAFSLARKMMSPYIASGHFFIAALKSIPNLDNKLLELGLEEKDFELCLIYQQKRWIKWRVAMPWEDDFSVHHLKGVNRGWIGAPTPYLDLYSKDLTKEAARVGFPEFIGRDREVSQVVNILSQENGRNVIIVAPAGSGKTTLVNYLAKRVISGDAPPALAIKRIVALDLTGLMSEITTQGQLAERVKLMFEEISFSQNVILVVEEIHNLGIGEAGVLFNLYSLLLPYIESSNIQFIGTTEPENYTRILEKNSAFARLFTKVELSGATSIETLQILEDRAIDLEKRTKLRVSFKAIKKCVELSEKLVHQKVLPDSALAILEQAEVKAKNSWVIKETIEEIVSEMINMSVAEVGSGQKEQLLNLEEQIHERLIDQEEAVKAVSDTLRRSATGLREEKRPIGSFLFVGPTGVGKTELAKILAELYFKNSGAFIRFDMSEYQTSESVSQLIGVSEEGGKLTDVVRNKPYCLLLLDEFEKALPQVLTLFLQVLEDGRLTDGAGRTVDFTNTIIIATSNAASLTIVNGLRSGKSLPELEEPISQELLQIFKPELINRFDKVVLFKPLSEEHLQKIVLLKLEEVFSKLKEKGYLIEFDDELVGELAKRGYDPVLGARPLRRLIQDTLEANLSKLILEEKLKKGDTFKVGKDMLN